MVLNKVFFFIIFLFFFSELLLVVFVHSNKYVFGGPDRVVRISDYRNRNHGRN